MLGSPVEELTIHAGLAVGETSASRLLAARTAAIPFAPVLLFAFILAVMYAGVCRPVVACDIVKICCPKYCRTVEAWGVLKSIKSCSVCAWPVTTWAAR